MTDTPRGSFQPDGPSGEVVPAVPAVPPPGLASAVVVGTGLIGTSIALALRERGVRVWLSDRDAGAAQLAADMGAGEVLATGEAPGADLAVLAVPPAAVAATLAAAQRDGLARVCTDVSSVKVLPLREAAAAGCDLASFVPGHPVSGRERSGPAAARAELFLGRPWVLCPVPETSPDAVAVVTELVVDCCRAQLVAADAAEHDRWVALVSHAPHLVAAAMAARLTTAPGSALAVAGQGLRDVTRVAGGESGLWAQILAANAGPVSGVLAAIAADLSATAEALTDLAATAPAREASMKQLTGLLDGGGAGVARIPGKRGAPAADMTVVQVIISDSPGELARLFHAAGEAGVNIEDVGIEHSPGLPVGVAELTVSAGAAERLSSALAAAGWPVRAGTISE